MRVELPGSFEHSSLRHDAELSPAEVEAGASEGPAIALRDHPAVESRMQCAHALPQLLVVLTVHHRTLFLAPLGPLRCPAVVLIRVGLCCPASAGLAPDGKGDQRPRIP